MLVNKKKDMTPFDMARRPSKQYPFLLPIIWGASWAMTRQFNLKIDKSEMRGVKPPYLVIGTHQGFSDYYVGPLAMFPRRAMYVSDMEGFAAFGKWVYRGVGCIGKRRYVADYSVISNIRYAIKQGQSVVVYPESRHSNVGTTAYIPKDIGRLAKILKVPVVILSANGSYLANPFWDEERTRKVPMKAKKYCLYTSEELAQASAEEVQTAIEKALEYNEYQYQMDNNIRIRDDFRAEGLHKPLYRCIKCSNKYSMESFDNILSCSSCGASWQMTELGDLRDESGEMKEVFIPDWYEWERQKTVTEPVTRYFKVRVEALPNEYGFVDMGEGELILNDEEFTLRFNNEVHHFPHRFRESVQTEYNYRGKGMAIVLSTQDCCYYIYSDQKDFNPTELQFIGERLFQEKNR